MFRSRGRRGDTATDTMTGAAPVDDPAPDVYPADETGDDHALHLGGETCARCGEPIRPNDEARRTAKGDCVHLIC